MKLVVADLTGAHLRGVDLRQTWGMANIVLRDAFLNGADMAGTDMVHADLTNADLTGADLEDGVLDCVIWTFATCPDGNLVDGSIITSCYPNHMNF